MQLTNLSVWSSGLSNCNQIKKILLINDCKFSCYFVGISQPKICQNELRYMIIIKAYGLQCWNEQYTFPNIYYELDLKIFKKWPCSLFPGLRARLLLKIVCILSFLIKILIIFALLFFVFCFMYIFCLFDMRIWLFL